MARRGRYEVKAILENEREEVFHQEPFSTARNTAYQIVEHRLSIGGRATVFIRNPKGKILDVVNESRLRREGLIE